MELDEFVTKLDGVSHMPSGVAARCPSHPDKVQSLSVNEGKHGGIVVKCHAGCTSEAVVAALGLGLADLMGAPRLVETYPYTTPTGQLLYEVERWANPKTFRCRPALPVEAQRVLYNLPAVAWARNQGVPVYYCEGEKDVNTLARLGIPATTNVVGAGKWLPHYAQQLAGCHVIVVADNDDVGRLHARTVAAGLMGAAASVALMRSPVGKDVTEMLDAGYTLDNLVALPEVDTVGSYRADRVRVRSINWAWLGYMPLAKISMIEGDPGSGKSLLTLDLAARWSTGTVLPDGSNGAGPWPVILVSAEDDPADTILPRLIAAGARLDLIHLVTHGASPEVPFDLVTGVPALRQLIHDTGARAIVLDPLSAFLGDSTDSHNDHSVRRALQPLKVLAEQTGAVIVCVRHLNKSSAGTRAMYRSSGSIGFVAAARASFVVAEDPDDPDARILANVKSNLSRRPTSLRYEINHTPDGVPYVRWRGAVEMSAQTALDGPERHVSAQADDLNSKRKMREYAANFLEGITEKKPLPWVEIVEQGKEEGFSAMTLQRARADAGMVKITGTHGQASTTWRHPKWHDTQSDTRDPHLVISSGKGVVSVEAPKRDEMTKWPGGRSPSVTGVHEDGATDADLSRQLAALPLVCSVCGTDQDCARYERPYWVVRCGAHDPAEYEG